jgi:hypothetical protein
MRSWLIAVTVLLVIVTVPHTREDFCYGDLARLGISVSRGHLILAMAYTLQLVGIILTILQSRVGPWLLGAMGAIWCVGAIVIHGHDLLFAGPSYRHGAISKLLEVAIIALGATTAVLAVAITRPQRSST